jgi:hypothetical protein
MLKQLNCGLCSTPEYDPELSPSEWVERSEFPARAAIRTLFLVSGFQPTGSSNPEIG